VISIDQRLSRNQQDSDDDVRFWPVIEETQFEELPQITSLLQETENELNGKGRVLLRYSGTEPKVRLLIEGREQSQIDRQADRIADAIQSAIGA